MWGSLGEVRYSWRGAWAESQMQCLPCSEAWFYPVGSEGDLDGFTQNNEQVIVMCLKNCSGTVVQFNCVKGWT